MNHTTSGHRMDGMGHTVMPADMNHTMGDMDHHHTGGMGHTNMPAHMNHTMGDMDHEHMVGGHNHNSTSMNHGNHMDGTGHMMSGGGHSQMYFGFEMPIQVLFYGWRIDDQGQLAGSCIGVLLLAILYEGIKGLREYLYRLVACRLRKSLCKIDSNGSGNDAKSNYREPGALKKMFNGWHILHSLLQIIQTTLGMFLMLIFMTFNVWLALSVSLGSGVGYFLFGWNKQTSSMLNEDHCL